MPMHQPQLPDPHGKFPVGVRFHFIDQHPAGTAHGLHRKILPVDHRGIHVFPVMLPMPGSLPQISVQNNGCRNLHIPLPLMELPPVIDQQVFQHHPFGQEKGKSRPLLHQRKQPQLLPKLSVIALFGLLQHLQVGFQPGAFRKGNAVDPGKHLIVLIPPPVRPCHREQLQGLDPAGIVNVGACTEFYILPLPVKADTLSLRKFPYHFRLVRLLILSHKIRRLLPGNLIDLQRQRFLHDLFHLPFNGFQILLRKREAELKIIVKSIFHRRADGAFCLRV